MANLLPSWNLVRVYGTWGVPNVEIPNEWKKATGTYTVEIPGTLTNATDDVIIPGGVILERALDLTEGTPSLDIMVPATDDPDIQQSGWKVTIKVTLATVVHTWVIDVPLANRPIADGGNGLGVNLRTIALSSSIQPQIALYGVGVAGGLARLSNNGLAVLDANGSPISAGAWGAITGTLADQEDLQAAFDAKATGAPVDALNEVGLARMVVIPNGGTLPAGIDPYTIVAELDA